MSVRRRSYFFLVPLFLTVAGCAIFIDLKNPETISSDYLRRKSVNCLTQAKTKIEKSLSIWQNLKSISKSYSLKSSYSPLEGTATGEKYEYKNGKLVLSEAWKEDISRTKTTSLPLHDPYEAQMAKCINLASTKQLAEHTHYCFSFSREGYLVACGDLSYWPGDADATCLGEDFLIQDIVLK